MPTAGKALNKLMSKSNFFIFYNLRWSSYFYPLLLIIEKILK